MAGRLPDGAPIVAAWDTACRFTEAELRPTRLGALLAPYRSREAAVAALEAAGAAIEGVDG